MLPVSLWNLTGGELFPSNMVLGAKQNEYNYSDNQQNVYTCHMWLFSYLNHRYARTSISPGWGGLSL